MKINFGKLIQIAKIIAPVAVALFPVVKPTIAQVKDVIKDKPPV